MDSLDQKILELLKQDSRLPFVEIASRVGLSESAVRRRVANLVKSGVIKKFTVELAETQNMRAITFVSINPSVPTSEVSQKIKEMNGVEVVYETTGEFDIIAVIIGTNIAEINRVIEEIRRIPGVIDTNTSIILRTIR